VGTIRTKPVCSCLPIRPHWPFPYDWVAMEPTQLQLVFNVIGITGMSSLASFCYLLRKENRKLTAELKPEPKQTIQDRSVTAMQSAVTGTSRACGSLPPVAVHITKQDVRDFAADRRAGWVKSLTSAISHDGCC
jgi:hypothetical protein